MSQNAEIPMPQIRLEEVDRAVLRVAVHDDNLLDGIQPSSRVPQMARKVGHRITSR
jgi:hypothetical protein